MKENKMSKNTAINQGIAALRAQIEAHRLLSKAAGLNDQAHLDGTAQARRAIEALQNALIVPESQDDHLLISRRDEARDEMKKPIGGEFSHLHAEDANRAFEQADTALRTRLATLAANDAEAKTLLQRFSVFFKFDRDRDIAWAELVDSAKSHINR